MKATLLLASGLLATIMCAPASADDKPIPPKAPPTDERMVPLKYNQIPHDYDEFVGVYNKVLAFLHDTDVTSRHKCFPLGSDPNWSHSWCEDVMRWGDPQHRQIAAIELQFDDGKAVNEICLSDDPAEQRCFRSDGKVLDQALNKQTSIYLTYKVVAGAWNERGKPLPELKPHEKQADANDAHNPPTDEHTAPPPAENIVPPTYNQIPRDYDEFVDLYNKTLAFLRDTDVQPQHKCLPLGSDPTFPHGWCAETMKWGDTKGQRVVVTEGHIDNGTEIDLICFGNNPDEQRCFRSDGRVVDQALNKKTNIYLTYKDITGTWNERGKSLSELKPRQKRETKR